MSHLASEAACLAFRCSAPSNLRPLIPTGPISQFDCHICHNEREQCADGDTGNRFCREAEVRHNHKHADRRPAQENVKQTDLRETDILPGYRLSQIFWDYEEGKHWYGNSVDHRAGGRENIQKLHDDPLLFVVEKIVDPGTAPAGWRAGIVSYINV